LATSCTVSCVRFQVPSFQNRTTCRCPFASLPMITDVSCLPLIGVYLPADTPCRRDDVPRLLCCADLLLQCCKLAQLCIVIVPRCVILPLRWPPTTPPCRQLRSSAHFKSLLPPTICCPPICPPGEDRTLVSRTSAADVVIRFHGSSSWLFSCRGLGRSFCADAAACLRLGDWPLPVVLVKPTSTKAVFHLSLSPVHVPVRILLTAWWFEHWRKHQSASNRVTPFLHQSHWHCWRVLHRAAWGGGYSVVQVQVQVLESAYIVPRFNPLSIPKS